MYQITSVDDSAKGFPNEFRVAQMVPVLPPFMGLVNPYWPTPYP
jgi:glycerol kinase